MGNKRYYWLKLKEDFFRQKEIKKLRKIAGGDTFTIIYLKMLLKSLKDNGRLYYDGIEENFVSELALDIDEDDDNVKMTVGYLLSNGILIQNNQDEFEILTAQEMTGSECDSAHRVRRMRAKADSKTLQSNDGALPCNSNVTKCNIDIDIDKEKREKSNIAETGVSAPKPKLSPDEHEFWKFAKENAELAETFYRVTGISPVKSQFGRWVNDLKDLAEADISPERLRKTIEYMYSENIPVSAPGSCLKTAQYLKSRGSVPVRKNSAVSKQDRWDIAAQELKAELSHPDSVYALFGTTDEGEVVDL